MTTSKQKEPTATAGVPEPTVQAWGRLLRVSQALVHGVGDALKEAELPPLSWYDVLWELRKARPDGLRPFELQRRVVLRQYNLSRLLARLESEGHVERVACADDGRGHVVQITRGGNQVLRQMWPVYEAFITERFAARLSTSDVTRLEAILAKLQG